MAKKYPRTIHIRLSTHFRTYIDKRCKELNKDILDESDTWTPSKFIRWLIRQEMQGKVRPQALHQLSTNIPQADHDDGTGYYDDLLNLTRG